MDPVLRELLLTRLQQAPLDAEAKRVIALAVDAAEGHGAPEPATPVWLRSISVEGFRGIGPRATLRLEPVPGLTVVVGRNGSGKSSFAEGLELLMTGRLKRWEKRPKAWSETWQCLHHDGPTVLSAELQTAGRRVTLEQSWPQGAPYGDQSDRARAQALLEEHGWARALESFRPFLAYAELATMFDTLSSLYDALTPVLGLSDLDELAARLGQARLQYDNQRKQSNGARENLLRRLDPDDERAALVAGILRAKQPDLDALEQLLEEAPTYSEELARLRQLAAVNVPGDEEIVEAFQQLRAAERAHAAAARTDAAKATNLAALLKRALQFKDPERLTDDCPVCGTPDVLDDAWARSAQEQVAQLEEQAAALTQATADLNVARRRIEALAPGVEPTQERVLEHVRALRARTEQARAELSKRDAAWQELAALLRHWLAEAREVEQRAPTLAALKEAEKWVKAATDALRAERFAPISEQAIANWRRLRQGSSVDLREITLKKVGRGGRADFDVRADDQEANALGVMSQGELLALSVSVFLPRAGLEESPFRFAVIDDPVQAMDPAKVDGLAQVLHEAARTRQIVVFTHDDRLPEAIRRLQLEATLLHVDRRAGSTVAVQKSRSPVQRYLDGARSYARSDRLPPAVQARVVPMFCRNAVEAGAANLIRARAAASGTDLAEADAQIAAARSLRETLALVLFGDAGRHGEVGREIAKRYGPAAATLVTELNRGAHGNALDAETLRRLPDATRSLIADLGR